MTEATTTAPVETKNEAVPELMPDPITFTDAAVAKVKSLMDEEGNPDLKLRVFVQGGGCAGFQYGLAGVKQTALWCFTASGRFFHARGVLIRKDIKEIPCISALLV